MAGSEDFSWRIKMERWIAMKKQWLIAGVIAILAVLAVYQSTAANKGNEEKLAEVGFAAPSIRLKDLNGETRTLEMLNGKPVVLNFWTSWCPPCQAEAPELVRLYEKYKDHVEIYAVNITVEDKEEYARQFAEYFGFEFPVLLDKKGKVSEIYQVSTIPTTYFVNDEGIITDKVIGLLDPKALENKFAGLIP
jgi:thiol-disulfide isomerase/thioredoxin